MCVNVISVEKCMYVKDNNIEHFQIYYTLIKVNCWNTENRSVKMTFIEMIYIIIFSITIYILFSKLLVKRLKLH